MTKVSGISAIIPTHNRSKILRRTLESLIGVQVPEGCRFEVIVVGNCCTDDTREVVESVQGKGGVEIRYFEELQVGANFARNAGFSQARYEIIGLLDDDLWVDSSWYKGIRDVYESTDAAIVGGPAELWWEAVQKPEWFTQDMEWILSGTNLGAEIKEVPEGVGLIGCNLTARRDVFSEVGLFNTAIDRRGASLMGGFESDFMKKASLAGFRCYYTPESPVKHWVAPHRIQENYILGICEGYGEARIYIKTEFNLYKVIRALVGHFYLLAESFVRMKFNQNRTHLIREKLRFSIAKGGLRGIFCRLSRRSPVSK